METKETKGKTEAQRFVEELERNQGLRQDVFAVPRKHFLQVAEQHGFKVTGQELYDAMRAEWASAKVPRACDVDEKDDPDTCCCSTFSESPEF